MSKQLIGSLDIYMGCMFSGKSTELQRYVRRLKTINAKYIIINHKIDTRYGENHTDSSEELFYIYKNFHNKKILNRLLEDKINVLEKLQIIEREDIFNETMCINILNGGLLDDFNFEI